jgi:hypothetical protein
MPPRGELVGGWGGWCRVGSGGRALYATSRISKPSPTQPIRHDLVCRRGEARRYQEVPWEPLGGALAAPLGGYL